MQRVEEVPARKVLEPLAWLLQLFSGIALAVLIAVHFYVIHLASHEAIGYIAVMARMSLAAYKVMYVTLLILVAFHAFNGLRAILLDTNFGADNRTVANTVTVLLFIVTLLYGAYLLWVI